MLKLLFLAGPTREIPSARSRWAHLARSGSQSEHRIRFILLLADSAMYSLRGRPARDGCQSALWDCFGGHIFNMAANSSPKTVPECTLTTISTQSPAQPQSGQ